jgi:inosine-uridine nucleoside N-ribohydrolase
VRLGSLRDDVTWVNIWQDPEAAEHVKTLREGNEMVPTPVTGAGEVLPIDARSVRAFLEARS